MSITLSIENVPELIAQNISQRASRHHRTLQSELMAILEEAVKNRSQTPSQILTQIQQMGLETQAESVDMIRRDRNDH